MNILLCSVGRRPYLIEWFKDAQRSTGSNGLVVAADVDPHAPSQAFADIFELAPPASDPEYPKWLLETLEKYDVDLAISVNDFELSQWAGLPTTAAYESLLRLTPELQAVAEDKLQLRDAMVATGVRVPETWLLRTALDDPSLVSKHEALVLKGRYGSASRGLRVTAPEQLEVDAVEAYKEVTRPDGTRAETFEEALDLFVVQPYVEGQEYGVDVVNDLEGSFVGALVRKKIKMRYGETDQAVSVDAAPFEAPAAVISSVTGHRGLIDTDMIVDHHGVLWLIDLNARFGGGYPISHLAGADVPSAYLVWIGNEGDPDDLLSYDAGVSASKFVGVARTDNG